MNGEDLTDFLGILHQTPDYHNNWYRYEWCLSDFEIGSSLFVGTNVFLRFLTNDDSAKAKRAETLFRNVLRGQIRLATSLLFIAEIIWTLESFYHLEKPDIAAKVEKILNTPNLDCPEAPLLYMALDLYVHANIDFVDAYNAFHMKE